MNVSIYPMSMRRLPILPRVSRVFLTPLVLLILTSAAFSGCFGDEEGGEVDPYANSPITLTVYYETTAGHVMTESGNGPPTTTGAEFSFNFTKTFSDDGSMVKFWFNPDDGSDAAEADASQESVITYTYMTHGTFDGELGAEDAAGNIRLMEVILRVDMHVKLSDQNCDSCDDTAVDATTDCTDGTPGPVIIEVSSNVTNPPTFLIGGTTTVTWSLVNSTGEEVAQREEQVGDGQESKWTTDWDMPENGTWTLKVSADGDNIDVENNIWIKYAEDESPPNPNPEGGGDPEE
jgi:hypothetical protein